ncbi:MAG: Asp-tRNA(Asn)/Glu-tRNA(Gln) amidotransferase A subunit family amidase [Candidatus Azotimanducaceae bacterium]
MIEGYSKLDAIGLAELIANKQVTAKEVIESAIHQAEAQNPVLNAIVTPMYSEALDGAKALDEVGNSNSLAGVPFLIKDLTMVKGVRCSMGSRLFQDFVPDHDAEIVKRYRDAGLLIMGKSNTPEIGLAATTESVLLGVCKNPWDLSKTAGGSSGGAAAAVAAGILPAAHASDGGGSIRIPASCCGLVGLKPSRGRTPLGPDVGEGWGSMATTHVVSRTVRDSALMLDVTHGPAQGDPYHAPHFEGSFLALSKLEPKELVIGLDMTPASGAGIVHPECETAISRTVKTLEDMGHRVEPMELEFDQESFSTATHILVCANAANSLQTRAEALGHGSLSLDFIETNTMNCANLGKLFTAEEYAKAVGVIHATGRQVEDKFQRYDLILSPTLLQPPVPLGYMNTNDGDQDKYSHNIQQFWGYTHLYNATGSPAISLPLHWSEDGLPVGVQFAAAYGNEVLLLQIATALEQALPWNNRTPNI